MGLHSICLPFERRSGIIDCDVGGDIAQISIIVDLDSLVQESVYSATLDRSSSRLLRHSRICRYLGCSRGEKN